MNTLLQLTDAITGRRCAVRIDPEAAALPLSGLLDKYVKHFPARRLIEEGRVTVESSEDAPEIPGPGLRVLGQRRASGRLSGS